MLYMIRCAFATLDGSSNAFTTNAGSQSEDTSSVQPDPNREKGLELVRQSRQLFRGLADDSEKGRLERGFLLALLDINRESLKRNLDDGEHAIRIRLGRGVTHTESCSAQSLLPLVEEYFDRFGTKMCCFDDLLTHLADLNDYDAAALRDKMSADISRAENLVNRD